jgi:tungstate transport system ATP-binding protein
MIDNFQFDYRNIDKQYRRKAVLSDVSFTLSNSDCFIITGENGAGKTTLLRILAGIEKPDKASISINHAEPKTWRACRSHLAQSAMYLHQQPYMLTGTVRRNLEYTARLNPAIIDKPATVDQIMHWAGLEHLTTQNAVSLSGGQQQRVALARARLRAPQLLLLDEPTANLDTDGRGKTLSMLQAFQDSGTAIVISTHDPNIFAGLRGHALHLEDQMLLDKTTITSKVFDFASYQKLQRK